MRILIILFLLIFIESSAQNYVAVDFEILRHVVDKKTNKKTTYMYCTMETYYKYFTEFFIDFKKGDVIFSKLTQDSIKYVQKNKLKKVTYDTIVNQKPYVIINRKFKEVPRKANVYFINETAYEEVIPIFRTYFAISLRDFDFKSQDGYDTWAPIITDKNDLQLVLIEYDFEPLGYEVRIYNKDFSTLLFKLLINDIQLMSEYVKSEPKFVKEFIGKEGHYTEERYHEILDNSIRKSKEIKEEWNDLKKTIPFVEKEFN